MKTIVLGYEDANGNGPATLLAGPDVPQHEQIKLVNDAKTSGNYPKGIVRLEFCIHEPRTIAISTAKPKTKKP